jgi:hypothetical protein
MIDTLQQQRRQPQRDYLSLTVLGASLCLLVVGGIVTLQRALALPPAPCTLDAGGSPIALADMGLPNHLLVLWGVALILVGRLLGSLRDRRDGLLPTGPRAFSLLNRKIVTAALVVIFLGVSFALFYEALGVMRVAQGSILQPITYYTRCAIHYDIHPDPNNLSVVQFPLLTVLVTASVCFVLGHWFWYPRRKARKEA